jgi:hypothetical protein
LLAALAGTRGAWAEKPSEEETAMTAERNAEVRAALEEYIEKDVSLKGGFFIRDAEKDTVQSLAFDNVHMGVHGMPDGSFFACADFMDAEGKVFDLDVYARPGPGEDWEIVKILIHKEDGIVREGHEKREE